MPAVPNNEPKVRLLPDLSEGETTAEETSNVGSHSLYGSIPGVNESGAEVEDKSGPNTSLQQEPIASTFRSFDEQVPELPRRSQAVLKTYFLEKRF